MTTTTSPARGRWLPFLAAFLTLGFLAHAEPSVESTLLAPANAISVHVASNGRVSAVVRQGSRMVVTIDGEAGPRFDSLLAATGNPMLGRQRFPALTGQDALDHPVMFSADGARYGYIGLQGEEYVVIIDGKEVHRAPYYARAIDGSPQTIRFSPQGKHVWFVATHDPDGQPSGAYHVFMDGRRLPERILGGSFAAPAFSPDEKRHAVATFTDPKNDRGRLMIDGQVASYFGVMPRFLPNGKLLAFAERDGLPVLLLDGKVLNTDVAIRRATISADNRIAAVTSEGVWLDGKILPDTAGAQELMFSPNGKRLAIKGSSGTGQDWLWLDGKRSQNYQAIQPIGLATERVYAGFSADSSVCIAVAFSGGLEFPLVNGLESDGYKNVDDPVFAPKGSRYGYQVTFENGQSGVVVDGRMFTSPEWRVGNANARPAVVPESLQFSADGAHSAFVVGGREPVVYLDGEPMALTGDLIPSQWYAPGYNGTGPFGDATRIVFSETGTRFALPTRPKGKYEPHVLVDGHVLWTTESARFLGRTFTPDGKHFVWVNLEKPRTAAKGMDMCVYVNGREALRVPPHALNAELQKYLGWTHRGADGKFHLLSIDDEGIKRHTVTPSADFDLDAAIAAGPAASAEGSADIARATEPAAAVQVTATAVTAQPIRATTATPLTGAAPVEPLTWTQLVRKREAWPAQAKLGRELRFADGAVVRAGSPIAVIELKPKEVVASASRGAITFSVEPEATDVLDVANTAWAGLTPEQRELTYAKLARSPEFWPYEIKLTVPIELPGAPSQRPGSPVLLLGYERNQLLVRIPKVNIGFNIEPANTDLFARARDLLADQRGARGRLLEEFAAARPVDPATQRPAKLDLNARPKYVVMYMGAGWCPPCKVFAPKLVKTIADRRPAAGEVTFLFLSGDKTPAAAREYAAGLGIDWPMLTFTSRDQLPAFQGLFGDSIPQLVVTDRHGTVVIDSAKVGQDRALALLSELL